MLKFRIMPTMLYKDTTLVKGIGFDSWRRVGSLMQAIKVYNMREVDELVFFDISASLQKRGPDFQLVDDFADECFMPLTVGGGITTVDDVRILLMRGADKVAINSAAVEDHTLLGRVATHFGSQCVVASIDYLMLPDGSKKVFTHSGTGETHYSPLEFATIAVSEGAGEILLTSIDRDGTMQGYDVETLREIASRISIPVIASGGAGSYADMAAAVLEGHASAVAAASIFHFTQQTPLEAKRYLRDRGIPTRI